MHTELSLLDSCTNYKLYVDKAVELGQKALAFTEHGNIYQWVEKKMYCDAKGIKYLHGIECYLTETHEPNPETALLNPASIADKQSGSPSQISSGELTFTRFMLNSRLHVSAPF